MPINMTATISQPSRNEQAFIVSHWWRLLDQYELETLERHGDRISTALFARLHGLAPGTGCQPLESNP